MRYLVFIFFVFGNLPLKSQSKKDSIYPENKIDKSQIKSENQLYDVYTSVNSGFLNIQKSFTKRPLMTTSESQLGIINVGSQVQINHADILNVFLPYINKGIKRAGFKDYTISLQYFIDKTSFEIDYIYFRIPKTLLKNYKDIGKIELELTKKTRFSFNKYTIPKDFKPSHIVVNFGFTEKDLAGKF